MSSSNEGSFASLQDPAIAKSKFKEGLFASLQGPATQCLKKIMRQREQGKLLKNGQSTDTKLARKILVPFMYRTDLVL